MNVNRRTSNGVWLVAVLMWLTPGGSAVGQQNAVDVGRVDALFADWTKPGTPGCALGVIKDGKLVYSRGYGLANLEHNIPLTSATVFDIGSTGKQFTAASVMLLSQEGRLSLEDDVRKFIPELPDYGHKITIRHLLNHTSGIRDYLGLMSLSGINFDDTTGDDEALKLIIRQKALNFEPGSEFLYSNSGYFLLSIVVRRASGKTLRQFAEEKIFAPLGMKRSHYHDNHTMIVPNRATGYAPGESGAFRIDMSNFEQTGDGAVYTSIEDLLLWDRNFYEPKVGGRAMYDQLLTQGVLNNGKKLNYALGLMVDDYKGLKMIHHGGGWAGYRAELIRFPEQRLSVICLSNLAAFNPSKLARQVADIFLADQIKSPTASGPAGAAETTGTPPVKLTDQELKALAGLYRDAKSGSLAKVYALSDRLMVDYIGLRFAAVPLSSTKFRGVGPAAETTLDFEAKEGHARLNLRMSSDGPVALERVELDKPTPDQLKEYAGEYYSNELDTTYTLAVNGHRLEFGLGSRSRRALEPVVKGVFSSLGMELTFSRDAQGKVTGFDLNAGRVKGLRFIKK